MRTFPAILGMAGVALGALGAHALKPRLETAGTTAFWQTAVLYHLIHAVALLAIAVALITPLASDPARPGFARWLRRASRAWTAGIVLFSGSLYWLALGGPRWLGPATPAGGVALLAGWACVIAAARSAKFVSKTPAKN